MTFTTLTFAALSTTQKINKENKNLKSTAKQERTISQKISNIAREILKGEKNLELTDRQITDLEVQIKSLQLNSKEASVKLKRLTQTNESLYKTKKELEEKIIKIIADKFSFFLITDKGYQESQEGIMANEVLRKMDAILKKDFQELSKKYDNTSSTIEKHNLEIKDIEKSLRNLRNKQTSLKKLRTQREKNILVLKNQKTSYKKKLQKIVAQKNELQETLKKLKIIRAEEIEASKTKKIRNVPTKGNLSVRQIGSSYQQSRVKKYKGAKTIAPLDNYTVKQEFGNYIDPIYKIKIFNESVVLRSKTPNAKVKNVLSGKVIFAKDTAMLNKVVIVENKLGIHTIYAHMDKIAPTIKAGKKIKKGYVIGRVESDLTFEVTQKNYHINPLELIKR